MSKNHSKIDCRDLFNKVLDLDLIDMNPLKKEMKLLPKSPIINNFFISKKDYLKNKENSIENLYIKNQRRIIKRNSYNLYNSYKNNINVSFGDIIKIADKKYLVESYNPYSKLYKLKNLTTFTNHYFDLKNMSYSKLLSHDVKFDLETYEKKLLVKVKEIQKNIYKRKTLLKEKLKKYDYALINTESDSDYSSDWEDCSWEYCSDLEIPPLESDDEFDFIGDFTYNPIKPKCNFPDNIFDKLEKGEIINKPKLVEKTQFNDPLFDFFNSENIVEEYEGAVEEKTIDDIDFSFDKQLQASSFLECKKNREIKDPIEDFIDLETHNKNREIIDPVLKIENILYTAETSTKLIKYKPIYDCKADIKEINFFDNDLRYGGFNNLWNFNNKINIEEDDNQKIIFSTPINLFNTDNSKSFKPEKDMITPITNFLNESPVPQPYEKNLVEDIKVENIPQAYNKLSTGEKLAPIFDIDNNYFSMIREENIKNLDLTEIQPKIIVSKIIDNTEGENTECVKIKNEIVNECVKDDTIDNSWGSYCQIM